MSYLSFKNIFSSLMFKILIVFGFLYTLKTMLHHFIKIDVSPNLQNTGT